MRQYFKKKCAIIVKVPAIKTVREKGRETKVCREADPYLIPHCIALGEAAGTGAAPAIDAGVEARDVNISALQDQLFKQGVLMPGAAKTAGKGIFIGF